MTPTIINFDHLAGAECRYARAPVAPYGTIGKGPRKQRLESGFHAALTAALEELWSIHPWGRARYIVSAGAMVTQSERRGPTDPHVRGIAYDIDSIWWKRDIGLVALDAPHHWRHYLAIQCILARHCGITLGYDYNKAHRDHWHVDSTRPVGFHPSSRMCVVLLQRCLNEIWGRSLIIDGKWGPLTRDGWRGTIGGGDLRVGTIEEDWRNWLLATAKRGLEGM